MKTKFFALTVLLFSGSNLNAQATPTLIKDIFPGVNHSVPSSLTKFYDNIYFQATDGSNGKELWKSDGTESGTVMLKDIAAGNLDSSPSPFIQFGNKLYFTANDHINGNELWVTDGTAAGTTMFKNINPSGDSYPRYLTVFNNRLFFMADNGTNGRELWSSDGTEAGTTMFYDITPGSGHTGIFGMGVCGNQLFFSAEIDQGGTELWVSNGTTAGTMPFMDINTGANSSNPRTFTPFGNKLLFFAKTDANGDEPWITDGTTAGTTLLKDIIPGTASSGIIDFYVHADKAYFGAYYGNSSSSAMYVTDGTTAGTSAIYSQQNVQYVPSNFFFFTDRIYFKWYDFLFQNSLFQYPLTGNTVYLTGMGGANALAYGGDYVELNNKMYMRIDLSSSYGQELYSLSLPQVSLSGDFISNPICGNENPVFYGNFAAKYAFYLNDQLVQAMSTLNSFTATSLNDNDEVKLIGYNNLDVMIGKDSVNINKPTVNNTVTVDGNTIYSNQTSATYLWSGCDGTTLTGTHTGYALNMTETGSVQVQVTKDGCTVTSPCTLVTVEPGGENPGVGIESVEANTFTVYPNPTEGKLLIDFASEVTSGTISVTDLAGKLITTVDFNDAKVVSIELNGNAGLYLLNVQTTKGNTVKTISLK